MPPEIFLPISLICAGIVFARYYRIGRFPAGIAWGLIILSIGGFGSGLAGSFAWSGLVFLFIGGLGLVLLAQDTALRRQAKRRRERSDTLNLEREN